MKKGPAAKYNQEFFEEYSEFILNATTKEIMQELSISFTQVSKLRAKARVFIPQDEVYQTDEVPDRFKSLVNRVTDYRIIQIREWPQEKNTHLNS